MIAAFDVVDVTIAPSSYLQVDSLAPEAEVVVVAPTSAEAMENGQARPDSATVGEEAYVAVASTIEPMNRSRDEIPEGFIEREFTIGGITVAYASVAEPR